MRGRKPIPDSIKESFGTLRKCRQKSEAPSDGVLPRSPFGEDTVAGRQWVVVTTALQRLGLWDSIDGTHVEGYCSAYQLAKHADKAIEAEGMVLQTQNGCRKNPHCTVSADAWSKVRSFGNDLGLKKGDR